MQAPGKGTRARRCSGWALGRAVLGRALGHAVLGEALKRTVLGRALSRAMLGGAFGRVVLDSDIMRMDARKPAGAWVPGKSACAHSA